MRAAQMALGDCQGRVEQHRAAGGWPVDIKLDDEETNVGTGDVVVMLDFQGHHAIFHGQYQPDFETKRIRPTRARHLIFPGDPAKCP